MGIFYSTTFYKGKTPEHYPESYGKPSFEPELGFKAPRKERVSKLSLQEMKALKLPPNERDYCAHLMRDYIVCYRNYSPFFGMCYPEMRAHEHCETEDYILRMKEYERERRLKIRELKKQGKTIS